MSTPGMRPGDVEVGGSGTVDTPYSTAWTKGGESRFLQWRTGWKRMLGRQEQKTLAMNLNLVY